MRERVLIAGVGYRNLRDHSVGPELIDRLAREYEAAKKRVCA